MDVQYSKTHLFEQGLIHIIPKYSVFFESNNNQRLETMYPLGSIKVVYQERESGRVYGAEAHYGNRINRRWSQHH